MTNDLKRYFRVLAPTTGLPPMSSEQINKRLAEDGPARWYNRIDVVPGLGIFTKPFDVPFDGGNFFGFLGVAPTTLRGMRVLDIGAFDGAVSFYAEDQGAEVVAIDIQNPATNGFSVVHECRRSSVTHVTSSIYDLHPTAFGKFDLVVCSGVHYHLRHPLLAFERINSVMMDGAILLVIGTTGDYWLHAKEDFRNGFVPKDETAKAPLCGFYRDKYMDDRSNWFIPNTECLKEMLISCGFDIEFAVTNEIVRPSGITIGCASIRAKRTREPDAEFDVDVYAHLRTFKSGESSLSPKTLVPSMFDYRESGPTS
jgi:tRNA (mo5U34)-methyltransferase